MELTNEEKKTIGDAATEMMQSYALLKLADDRLATMNKFSSRGIGISMDEATLRAAMIPYERDFETKRDGFLKAIGADGKEFWEWWEEKMKEEELKEKKP